MATQPNIFSGVNTGDPNSVRAAMLRNARMQGRTLPTPSVVQPSSATPISTFPTPPVPSMSQPQSGPLSGYSLAPSSSASQQLIPTTGPQYRPSLGQNGIMGSTLPKTDTVYRGGASAMQIPTDSSGASKQNLGSTPTLPSYTGQAGQTPEEMARTGANGTPTNQLTSSGDPINAATGGVTKKETPTTPTLPTPPKQNPDVASALKAYGDAQQISSEEDAAQAELDRLQESGILGQNKIRDQAIPLDFLVGQGASLERQQLARTVPLEPRLARMQAKRQAALESSKFALERADKAAEADKPIVIDGQLVQKDPATGEYKSVFGTSKSQEGFTLGEGQQRYDAQGNLIASGAPKGASAATTEAKNKSSYQQADNAITSIDTAMKWLSDPNSSNMSETAIGRTLGQYIPGSSSANLEASLDTVRALVGFDTLQKMRESSPTGGALGSITERELAFLQSVQGSLSSSQSTEQLTATLARIKQSFETLRIISSPDGTEFPLDGQIYIKQGDQFVPKGFNQVGGDTQQASRPVRNNNPLNIKASSATSTYSGVAGLDPSPASDGGQFLVFQSPEAGFDAAKRLIQTDGYKNLTVDAALRRWSNNGYGASAVPQLANKTIAQLTSTELDSLIQAMARNEGYYA